MNKRFVMGTLSAVLLAGTVPVCEAGAAEETSGSQVAEFSELSDDINQEIQKKCTDSGTSGNTGTRTDRRANSQRKHRSQPKARSRPKYHSRPKVRSRLRLRPRPRLRLRQRHRHRKNVRCILPGSELSGQRTIRWFFCIRQTGKARSVFRQSVKASSRYLILKALPVRLRPETISSL